VQPLFQCHMFARRLLGSLIDVYFEGLGLSTLRFYPACFSQSIQGYR
jgi:hypothetical protein